MTLVLGGARSGKSRFALALAAPHSRRTFVATAEPIDREMEDRIDEHRRQRGPGWTVVEEPLRLADALRGVSPDCEVAVIDCLTVWLGNLAHHHGAESAWEPEIRRLMESLQGIEAEVIVVANEVGWGIVPPKPLTRAFRDAAGSLNQRVAALADRVVLVVAGQPLWLKGG